MDTMGASAGMVNWARILLHNTRASTHANGVESGQHTWFSGVRQGCPLSPLLYLFVAQSLASWLRAQPLLGVTIAGIRYVSTHYADDTQIHLSDLSPEALTSLTNALATFGGASGQHVNVTKSKAILMGATQPPLPSTLAGIPVVEHTTSLGITQCTLPPPAAPRAPTAYNTRGSQRPPRCEPAPTPAAWSDRMAKTSRRVETLGKLPLSAMGRGLAATAYALSSFLYHAEFEGLPPETDALNASVARAVGSGVAICLLTGSPARGGFGLLPVIEHIQARHAAMASRLLLALLAAPRSPPAALVAPTPALGPDQSPALQAASLAPTPLPAPSILSTVLRFLASLVTRRNQHPLPHPPVQVTRSSPMNVTQLCSTHNQPLAGHHPHHIPPWTSLASALLQHACPTLHPAQTLLAATLASPDQVAQGVLDITSLQQPHRIPPGTLTNMAVALRAVVSAAGPLCYQPGMQPRCAGSTNTSAVVRTLTSTVPGDSEAALATQLSRLQWQCSRPDSNSNGVAPAGALVSVRQYTALLTAQTATRRNAKLTAFVRQARGSATGLTAAVAAFGKARTAAWRTACCNKLKEPLWRLAINAIPGSNYHPWRCPCTAQPGAITSSRQHTFWECPVAMAVRHQITSCLGMPNLLQQQHVWLLQALPGIDHKVWTVVCLAALDAMEYGRKFLWAQHLHPLHQVTHIAAQPYALVHADVLPLVQQIANAAAARFWHNIQDYVHTCPPGPLLTLRTDHPFICIRYGQVAINFPQQQVATGA